MSDTIKSKIKADEEYPKLGKVIQKIIDYKNKINKIKLKNMIIDRISHIKNIEKFCNVSECIFNEKEIPIIKKNKELPCPNHFDYYKETIKTINEKFYEIIENNLKESSYKSELITHLKDKNYELLFDRIKEFIIYENIEYRNSINSSFYKKPILNYLKENNYNIDEEISNCVITKKYLETNFYKLYSEYNKLNAINHISNYLNHIGINTYQTNVVYSNQVIDMFICLNNEIYILNIKDYKNSTIIKNINEKPYIIKNNSNTIEINFPNINIKNIKINSFIIYTNNLILNDTDNIMNINSFIDLISSKIYNSDKFTNVQYLKTIKTNTVIDNKEIIIFYFDRLIYISKVKEHYIQISKEFESRLLKEINISKNILDSL